MSSNNPLYVRKAVIATWHAFAPLAALVDDRIYPPQRPAKPVRPFVGFGVPNTGPFLASCMTGTSTDFAGHCYASTGGTAGDTVSGEELCNEIAAEMQAALDAAGPLNLQDFDCPYPAIAHVTWERTQVIQDGKEASNFHGIVQFRVDVVS